MQRAIDKLARTHYDLLVIGGGINGAAIANMAAHNGLRCALLEKKDFASGTSGRSTKLIHGGLRYLENCEFGLVRESLRERHTQLTSAPHLVKPLGFLIPVYATDQRPLWMMRFGVSLYDFLSGRYLVKKHRSFSVEAIVENVPLIKKQGLVGGVVYYDAQMDDARLCLENVLSAAHEGADVANYAEALSFIEEKSRVVGVEARDIVSGSTFRVRAKKIVCAAGPWTNMFLMKEKIPPDQRVRTTKGIHIVYRGQVSKFALLIPTYKDKRIFFVIPWKGNSLIGTTDTDYSGDPDAVAVDTQDVDYLFNEARRVFPEAVFTKGNIIMTFAGLRPLVYRKGHPSRVSRNHIIAESASGVFYVMGGKYTTYRKIAEDCLRRVMKRNARHLRAECPLYGSAAIEDGVTQRANASGVGQGTLHYLREFYGTRFTDVLSLIEKDRSLAAPICSCSPALRAQLVYSIDAEMARTQEDIVVRRLSLVYHDCKEGACIKEVNGVLSGYKTK